VGANGTTLICARLEALREILAPLSPTNPNTSSSTGRTNSSPKPDLDPVIGDPRWVPLPMTTSHAPRSEPR
jgi:hypothetical protein